MEVWQRQQGSRRWRWLDAGQWKVQGARCREGGGGGGEATRVRPGFQRLQGAE